uniref:Serine/threonine-protein kinase PLK4 n=1 Tax=Culicoides sonorensis TaxID=179676 RepID=A0A336KJJ4_CULSO
MDFGESIEKYDVDWKCPLGKGGFATVYKARCKNTNQFVAIKMIDKEKMHKSGMANRVRQEVTIHSQLKHPSILELYTFFEDVNFVYLVLELAQKGELHRFLRDYKKTMNEFEASTILKQVVDGLLYLHSHRIVHRDISLSNLLLTEDMKVKIADFGLATLDNPGEKHMTLCGTPNYISPEVASRSSHGLAVDVWGLGCLLYTLLVGKPPFDTDAIKSTLARVVNVDFTIPSFVSYEARDLIERFLRKNPLERIKLEEVVMHPFILKAQKHAYSKYNNTLASSDSGILTMSSNTSQNQSKQTFNKSTIPRSRSEDHYNPMPVMHENSAFNGPCSNYSSYHETNNGQKSDHMLNSLNNHVLLQKFNSLDIDHGKENVNLVTAGIPKTNSLNSGSLYDSNGNNFDDKNPFAPRPPLLESQKMNRRPRIDSYNSPGLTSPLITSTPNQISSQPPTEVMNQKNPTPPLNTERLNATRHQTKSVILSILESGEVVIEFIKNKARYKEDRVVEVLRISKDGQKITFYMPNNGQGTAIQDDPPAIPRSGPDAIYNYDNLPSKYWKKYSYGAKFVAMVRAKTLKVTYHSPKCKFQMMESLEDFDSFFYNGTRISKSALEGVKLYESSGKVLYNSVEDICSSQYQDSWEHFNECMDHCLGMEAVLSRMETTGTCFPIVVGKRPTISTLMNKNFGTTPKPSMLTPVSSLENFSTPLNSLPRTSSLQIPAAYSHKNVIIRTVNIPGIGKASQYTQGVVEVDYEDGSKLSVIPPEQGDGVTYSKYGCMPKHYSKNDQLPDDIRGKLQKFQSIILKHLMDSPIIDCGQKTAPIHRSSSMRYLR